MSTAQLRALLFLTIVASSSGCMHTQLRWNTTHQSTTLTDIYEQQVMNNLARFVADPNALPSFAYPNAGGGNVTDNGSLGSITGWNRLGFSSESLNISGSRGMTESWTLQPVYDVRRLELMRCAYQQALVSAGKSSTGTCCPDCDKLQRIFYIGDPAGKYNDKVTDLPDDLRTFSTITGRTTPGCFESVEWLGTGKCVPKGCHCIKKGHYCGTYVWILPGGQDELTKLTLVILDYAFSQQAVKAPTPAKATKEVTWYIGKDGMPTSRDSAAQEIRATFPIDAAVRLNTAGDELPKDATDPMIKAHRKTILEEMDSAFNHPDNKYGTALQSQDYFLPPIASPSSMFTPLQLQQNLQLLTPPMP